MLLPTGPWLPRSHISAARHERTCTRHRCVGRRIRRAAVLGRGHRAEHHIVEPHLVVEAQFMVCLKTFSSQGPSLTLLLTTLRQSLLKCSLCAYQADWELQGLPTPTQPTILAHLLPIRHPSMRGWGRGLGKTHLALTLRPVLQSYTSYSLLQRLPYLLPITIPITIPTVSTIDTRRGWGPGLEGIR